MLQNWSLVPTWAAWTTFETKLRDPLRRRRPYLCSSQGVVRTGTIAAPLNRCFPGVCQRSFQKAPLEGSRNRENPAQNPGGLLKNQNPSSKTGKSFSKKKHIIHTQVINVTEKSPFPVEALESAKGRLPESITQRSQPSHQQQLWLSGRAGSLSCSAWCSGYNPCFFLEAV